MSNPPLLVDPKTRHNEFRSGVKWGCIRCRQLTSGKSWYKNNQTGAAKIRTLWPGSSQHAFVALRKPRWEDFDFERCEGYDHTMAWLGNGHIGPGLDAAFYYPELRSYHGVSFRRCAVGSLSPAALSYGVATREVRIADR